MMEKKNRIGVEQLALSFALSEVNNYIHYVSKYTKDILLPESDWDKFRRAYKEYVNDVRQRHGKEAIGDE